MAATIRGDSIVIGNRIDELRRMSDWLHLGAATAGISDDLVMKLDLCANEAVMNIISYAYPDASPREIFLELLRTGEGATLLIRDDGLPYNPLDRAEHRAPESLEDAQVGGLGVHLIRRLMARCAYERDGGFNILYLEARRAAPAANA
jgi:serine/threonine-protein kinase RsbW